MSLSIIVEFYPVGTLSELLKANWSMEALFRVRLISKATLNMGILIRSVQG